MSIPAYIPMLDLNNHLELGPNCPSDDIECYLCPERKECSYKVTKWQSDSLKMWRMLTDKSISARSQEQVAWELAMYLIHHRGYGRLADTLLYIARKEDRDATQDHG